MTAARTTSPTGTATPAPSPARIATYVVAVLGLGWLGPLIDRAAGPGGGEGPGRLLRLVLDTMPRITGPGIDGVVVIATSGVVAALLLATSTE